MKTKFSEVLESKIKSKAESRFQTLWQEMEILLRKNGMPRNILFDGFKGEFQKPEDNGDQWQQRALEVLERIETEKFVSELAKLESYFCEPSERQY